MKLTTWQTVTLIFVILYLVWEWNIQEYLTVNNLKNTLDTRVDLLFILPFLSLLIGYSFWQYFMRKQ